MPVDPDLLLILKSNGLGDGEPDLGEKLMTSFLDVLLERETVPAKILCLNSGILLTTEGSPAAAQMKRLADLGSQISTCGTCLDYFDRKEKLVVGEIGNMRESVTAMLSFRRVLSP